MKIIISIIYLLFGILSQSLLLWIFPYTGLGGLICYPLSILLSIIFVVFLNLMSNTYSKYKIFFILLFLQFLIEFSAMPQDGQSVSSKLIESIIALNNYDEIKFNDLTNSNRSEKVLYKHKYLRIDKPIITVQIFQKDENNESRENYFFSKTNGKFNNIYANVKIVNNEINSFIIEEDSIANNIIINKEFLNSKNIYQDSGKYKIKIIEEDFILKTGLEKILYFVTKVTRSPLRKQINGI